MKRFWIISTLAVLAAMIFGSMLHRRGQDASEAAQGIPGGQGKAQLPSFVSESQLPVQESEMPYDFPLMPELLPEPKSDLPTVKFASVPETKGTEGFPRIHFSAPKRQDVRAVKKIVTTVDLSKLESPVTSVPATEKRVEATPSVESAPKDGRFLPIVLHLGSDAGKLVLQGSIPTREDTEAIYAAAVKVVGEDSVDNHLKFSPQTIEEDWVEYLPAYIETFFGHSAGAHELIVVDGILKLRGEVPSENSRNGLVALADSLKDGGLTIDHELEVKDSLAGDLPELSDTYAALEEEAVEPAEVIELAMLDTAVQVSVADDARSRAASISAEEETLQRESEESVALEEEVDSELEPEPLAEEVVSPEFHGPAESPEEWAAAIKKKQDDLAAAEAAKVAAEKALAKAKAEEEAAKIAAAEKEKLEMVAAAKAEAEKKAAALVAAQKEKAEMEAAAKVEAEKKAAALVAAEKKRVEMEAAAAAAKEAELAAMIAAGEKIPDDGKPLIFYFETGSSEIISSDREKLARAIQRANVPRSIIYITAYADYRGGWELNRKLSLERADKVRSLIFAAGVADQVTAEITAKGDSQSVKQDMGKRETDEALKRSRRVVVEVYHLKR